MTLTVFDCLILTDMEFYDFISPFQFSIKFYFLLGRYIAIFSVSREMWSNTFFRLC